VICKSRDAWHENGFRARGDAMRAVVVGAGIGGLAAAIALRGAGVEAVVLERAGRAREIEAGLTIWPNGVQALRALGVEPPLLRAPLREVRLSTWQGRRLARTDCSGFEERYGVPALAVHAAELRRTLLAALGAGCVMPGADVARYAEDAGRVTAECRDGRDWAADLLVGADGLRSTVREQLLGDGEPRYTGVTTWRGIGPRAPDGTPMGVSWKLVGQGREFGFVPMADGRVSWFASREAAEGEAPWPAGHRAELLSLHQGWPEMVAGLVRRTGEADILRTDIHDRPPATHWSAGRVTLLGDAAHPMAHCTSQGACQALEDAVVLGKALRDADDAESALHQYERQRLRRANAMVRLSSRRGRVIHLKNPAARLLMELALTLTPPPLARLGLDRQLRVSW
jgi:2-polyprenyl-6-methoxyphenol hydroxylase-like FAD-dependent oxidoreductase